MRASRKLYSTVSERSDFNGPLTCATKENAFLFEFCDFCCPLGSLSQHQKDFLTRPIGKVHDALLFGPSVLAATAHSVGICDSAMIRPPKRFRGRRHDTSWREQRPQQALCANSHTLVNALHGNCPTTQFRRHTNAVSLGPPEKTLCVCLTRSPLLQTVCCDYKCVSNLRKLDNGPKHSPLPLLWCCRFLSLLWMGAAFPPRKHKKAAPHQRRKMGKQHTHTRDGQKRIESG